MKLHELRPAEGSRRPRTRVGRGIAAGQGKTAGRGTKGQKARAGGSIPPWFEGGQTPLHQRIPKLRGFRNPFKVQYEVVNIGRIGDLVSAGRLEAGEPAKGKASPVTVNQEILRATGLVSTLEKPLKILGHGDLDVALFVVADAFTRSARAKIEAAGGSVQVLELPAGPMAALGVEAPAQPATPLEPAPPAASAPAAGRRSRATRETGSTEAAGTATDEGSATGTDATATVDTATDATATAAADTQAKRRRGAATEPADDGA